MSKKIRVGVKFWVIIFFLTQVKAVDEAISKAEEQIEKISERAKETKVPLSLYFMLTLKGCFSRT